MTEPKWLDRTVLQILHNAGLAVHGGLEGLRDEGMLESALARPVNLHLNENCVDMTHFAASYSFRVARNHLFLAGNKRIAFVTTVLFLRLNGLHLKAPQAEAYEAMIHIADGSQSEDEFAAWPRKHAKKGLKA